MSAKSPHWGSISLPMMFQLDTDFKELFKIKAEFDNVMDRTDEK